MHLYISKISELIEKYDKNHKYSSLTLNRIKKTGVLKRENELKAIELLISILFDDVSAFTFSVSKNGKPSVNEYGLKFSYSHSQDLLFLQTAYREEVGADVQFISGQAKKVSRAFLNDDELKYADSDLLFTVLWTIKESIIKKYDSLLFMVKNIHIIDLKKEDDEYVSTCTFLGEEIIVRSKLYENFVLSYTSKEKLELIYKN